MDKRLIIFRKHLGSLKGKIEFQRNEFGEADNIILLINQIDGLVTMGK